MNEKEYTEKERKAAECVVNLMMDGGHTEDRLQKMAEELAELTVKDKEDSGFVLLVRLGTIGKTFCAMAGRPSSLCALIDSMMDESPEFEDCVRKVATVRALKGLLGGIGGRSSRSDEDEDDD